ncbi:hypothetical protein SAMN05216312_12310 [Cohnella sp. OV330]|nr:hypothetical protein SAMN05216312_12310 [Cohnella sp. OV330]
MQRQIHEMLRHPGFRAAQESLSQLVAQSAIAASSISQLQHQVGAAVQGIVGQLDAYAFSAAAVQRQIISMVDGIDWEALIEATEEEERAQLAEETNKIRELFSRDYLNLNALVLQVKDFIASLNIKNPAIYLLVTVFILQVRERSSLRHIKLLLIIRMCGQRRSGTRRQRHLAVSSLYLLMLSASCLSQNLSSACKLPDKAKSL